MNSALYLRVFGLLGWAIHEKSGKCPFIDRMKPLDVIQRFMRPSMDGRMASRTCCGHPCARMDGRLSLIVLISSFFHYSPLFLSSSSLFLFISPPFLFIFFALNCSSHPNKQIFGKIWRIHQHLSRIFNPSSPRYLPLNPSFENDYFHFLSPSFQVEWMPMLWEIGWLLFMWVFLE